MRGVPARDGGPVIVLGIDGGARGAVAVLSGSHVLTRPLPPRGQIGRLLRELAPAADVVVTEEGITIPVATSRGGRTVPGDGGKLRHVAEYQRHVGAIEEAAGSLGIRWLTVAPQTWQRDIGVSTMPGEGKARVYALVRARLPGMVCPQYAADAVAIALWGQSRARLP